FRLFAAALHVLTAFVETDRQRGLRQQQVDLRAKTAATQDIGDARQLVFVKLHERAVLDIALIRIVALREERHLVGLEAQHATAARRLVRAERREIRQEGHLDVRTFRLAAHDREAPAIIILVLWIARAD